MPKQKWQNEHCQIAARIYGITDTGKLDYRLIDYLNEIAAKTERAGGSLVSRQIVALAVQMWQDNNGEDFTK